jgi:uncharacterized protein
MLRNPWLIAGTVVVLALLVLFGLQFAGADRVPAVAASAAAAQTALPNVPRTITVVGEGSITVQPDIASTSVGVEVSAPTVKEATTEAASRMEKILAAVKAQGISDKDIKTSNYSINYEQPQPANSGLTKPAASSDQGGTYHVSNMVTLKIRDLSKVGQVIDAVVNAGANNLWGVDFTIEDTSKYEVQARAKAIADAQERAADLARLSKVAVGQVVEVSEVIGNTGMRNALAFSNAKGMGGGGPGPVLPGELEIATQIQMTFTIE